MNSYFLLVSIICSLISTYSINDRLYFLLVSMVITIYYSGLSIWSILKTKKIQSCILLLILSKVFSLIFNYNQILMYLLNISVILGNYYLIFRVKNSRDILYKIITFFSFINFIILNMLSPIRSSYKMIGSLKIIRNVYPILSISSASIIALLAIVISLYYIKNRKLKTLSFVINLIVLYKLGKLSVLGTLLLVVILVKIYKKIPIKQYKNIINIIFSTIIISPIILFLFEDYLIKLININRIFTGREEVWREFLLYTLDNNFIFGNGFFDTGTTKFKFYHPHNQYITIFYSLGIVGVVVYINFFKEVMKKGIQRIKAGMEVEYALLLTVLFLMIADDYFILTGYPIYLMIFFCILKNWKKDK